METISSKYGQIESPFTGVEYPVHSRDLLRSERFFVTPEQILELLVFMREVYPGLIKKNLTAARLYAIVMLITETGMRSIEVINLDALGDEQTRDRISYRHQMFTVTARELELNIGIELLI